MSHSLKLVQIKLINKLKCFIIELNNARVLQQAYSNTLQEYTFILGEIIFKKYNII